MNQIAHLAASTPTALDELAALTKATGDVLRLEILRVLRNDSLGVLELAQIFDVRQSGMSHHLKVLANAGLVNTRREGNSIFYRRSLPSPDEALGRLHEELLASLDRVQLPERLERALKRIHAQRAEISRQFFARFADGTPAQQDLLAQFEIYREPLLGLTDALRLPRTELAIEIGPGEGALLPDLAARFSRVVALDNSAAMLERAQARCDAAGLSNVDCLLGDALAPQPLPAADLLACNMVLHHMPAPAEALRCFAQLLAPGGSLVLTELCRHDQVWVRESCGDLWLGFDPDELHRWARDAGLEPAASLFIGLRNGFQLQIQQFARPHSTRHETEQGIAP